MKKLLFILLLLPLFAFPQAEKRYRSIIVDSVKALNGGRVDVKDTMQLDSLIVYGTDLSSRYTSRSLVDSAFVGSAISGSGHDAVTLSGAPDYITLSGQDIVRGLVDLGTDITGTTTATSISDFDTEVSNNASVAANTAKVTNAMHTGDVTGSGALTIANKAVEIVMLDDGTDGELITWDATGVATTVSTGSAGQVLTSNGAGAEPTFQAGGGADGNGIYDGSDALSSATTVTMGGNRLVFSGNETRLIGLNATSTDTALLVTDNVLTKLFAVSNAGHVIGGTDGGATFGTRDPGIIAKYSFTAGLRNTATNGLANASSFALGIDNDVPGFFAGAFGADNTVSARSAMALGEGHTINSAAEQGIACGASHTLNALYQFAGGFTHILNSRANYSLGEANEVTGAFAGALGFSDTINGRSSIGIGENISITGLNSLGIGRDIIVTDDNVIAIGSRNEVTGRDGIAIGLDLKADGLNAMVLGLGAGTGASRLINTIPTTWMFGANSTVPSLFMDNAGGVGLLSNIGLFDVTAFGTNAKGVLGIGSGTAPTTSPADMTQLYVADWNGSGTAALFIEGEEGIVHVFGSNVGINTVSPSEKLQVNGNTIIDSSLSTTTRSTTLGAGIATFPVLSNVMIITGDGGGNTLTTITGANSGYLLTLIFTDGNITIPDDNSHAANTIDVIASISSVDDKVLQLVFDGTSWYRIADSTN